ESRCLPRAASRGRPEGSEAASRSLRERALRPLDGRAATALHEDDRRRAGPPSALLAVLAPRHSAHRLPGDEAAHLRDLLRLAGDVRVGRLRRAALRAGQEHPRGPQVIHKGDEIAQDLLLKPDVCIIGSGPGGAMVAQRLARAGARVAVLEEGGFYTKDEFDMQEATAYPRLYQDRGNRASADLSIAVLQGRAVGGGTVVNWTTSYRTPDDVLAFWRERDGARFTSGDLRPHFDEVEQRLGIAKVDLEDTNPNNRALYDGCKKMGWSVDTIKRNVRECLRTGYCGMGCPIDAKQSATLTYLPDAVGRGTTIYANCRVR